MKTPSIRNVLTLVTAAPLALILAGCVTAPASVEQEAASRIHRVGVVSSTADVLTRQYTGVTAFGNEKEEMNISGWKLDAQYEEQLATELGKLDGITVVSAPYPRAAFSRVNESTGILGPTALGPNWGAIEDATRHYCSANNLDALLVVARTKTRDVLGERNLFLGGGGSNQYFGGAGIYVRKTRGKVSVLHLISNVALLDCKTAQPLAVRMLSTDQGQNLGAIVRAAPMLSLPDELARTPLSRWSSEQKQRLQAELSRLPIPAWSVTLRGIFPTVASAR